MPCSLCYFEPVNTSYVFAEVGVISFKVMNYQLISGFRGKSGIGLFRIWVIAQA